MLSIYIGGTSLKLGAWRIGGDGGKLERLAWEPGLPVPQTANEAAIADEIAQHMHAMASKLQQPIAAGVGSCGLIAGGRILQSPNTPWDSLALAPLLSTRLGLPVQLINDADAFLIDALGTLPAPPRSAVGLTLGTGLGTALWLDGRLLAGGSGISPEGGHLTLDFDGAAANTGIPGTWEALCCSAALTRYYVAAGGAPGVDAKAIKDAAEQGMGEAIEAWQRFGHALGAGLGSLTNLLSPEYALIGGGLSGAHGLFEEAMHAALLRHKLGALPAPQVRFLAEEQDAVARGAARYAAPASAAG